MPRNSRKNYNSLFLHIMVQSVNREEIFKDEFYKNLYLELIVKKSDKFNVKILAYVLMNNHAHLLVCYNDICDVSKFMHETNQEFAQLYNKNRNRVGHVFRNRYRSEQIINREYLYTVLAYIHFNPYRAGLIERLSDYKFSSYSKFINKKIEKEKIYILFETYDYISIFKEIHKRYFNKVLNNQNVANQIINNFMKKNKIEKLEKLNKEKKLLIQLILELKETTNLKEKEICKLLQIGKNRITQLRKEGFGELSP